MKLANKYNLWNKNVGLRILERFPPLFIYLLLVSLFVGKITHVSSVNFSLESKRRDS